VYIAPELFAAEIAKVCGYIIVKSFPVSNLYTCLDIFMVVDTGALI